MNFPETGIVPFLNGKQVLLTGATGFVGKLLLEQMLRKCDPARVHLLIRPRRGVHPQDRLEKQLQEVVYDRLKKEKPDFIDKIKIIEGDLSEINLGISEEARQELIDNVNIVIHSGATVRFGESLRDATRINVRGTLAVMQLAKQLKDLKACVHVSTAFAHCPNERIEEKLYTSPIHYQQLINITESLDQAKLSVLTNRILGEWPNTYTFTKAVAEQIIGEYRQLYNLPVAICRPAMITPTRSDPMEGWVDNVYGPIGLILAIAYGVLRVAPVVDGYEAQVVPGDMVTSSILALAYETSKQKNDADPLICNYTLSKKNILTWKHVLDYASTYGKEVPLLKAYWAFHVLSVRASWFHIYSFFLHCVPSLLIDIFLLVSLKKPRALRLYRKASDHAGTLLYFTLTNWDFINDNAVKLYNNLNETDKKLFEFNMETIDWISYLQKSMWYGRIYIAKESPEDIPKAVARYNRQKLIEKFVAILLGGLMFWWITNLMLKYVY